MALYPLTSLESSLIKTILSETLEHDKPLDKAVSLTFKQRKVVGIAQSHVMTALGDIMRRLNLYAYLLDCSHINVATRSEAAICAWHVLNELETPEFIKKRKRFISQIEPRLELAKQEPTLMAGCPDWLEEIGAEQLGDAWPAERDALAQAPQRFIRVNTLKCSAEQLAAQLSEEGIKTRALRKVPSALKVLSNRSLFKTEAFKNGWFEQQDAGSQMIAPLLGVEPGMRVIDACSGAGGKTLHLAAMMEAKGRLLAMDIEQWKLDNLRQRAKRAGASNIETRLIENSKTIKRLKNSADRLLLDVPCSGFGVLKRNPDTKWRYGLDNLEELISTQQDILTRYSQMVRSGGELVYATCSLLPVENEQQVMTFLDRCDGEFELVEQHHISPAETGFDGFYMAKLKRN